MAYIYHIEMGEYRETDTYQGVTHRYLRRGDTQIQDGYTLVLDCLD